MHLATHGYVKQDQLDESYLELADGPFTLADIYQLRLRPGALVVLSACKTGVAQNEPGREVTSLANGFMTAGAGSVVASLWPVDDEVTSRLFIRFYAYLDQGLGRAEALRRAQSDIATNPQTAHPYYWAAFFLYGDPR